MIKTIIFDMDGVIVDTEKPYQIAMADWVISKGYTLDQDQLNAFVGLSEDLGQKQMEVFIPAIDKEVYFGEFVPYTTKLNLDYRELLNPHIVKVLKSAKEKGFKIGLASSSPMDNIQHVVASCGLNSYFDVIVSGEQFTKSKPHPEIYIHTANLLGHKPEECIAVEDSTYGIRAAIDAGCYTLAKREERFGYDQSKAHHIIDDLDEVLQYISS